MIIIEKQRRNCLLQTNASCVDHVRRDETYLANTPVLLLSASVKNGIDSERKGARRRAKSAARGSIVFSSFVNLSQCQSVKILHLIAHLG